MPKPASTRPAYKMLTCIYLCRTLLFFAPYADFLSINSDNLPENAVQGEKLTYRTINIDGEEFEFSKGFTELHTESYKDILAGKGFGIEDARNAINIVYDIRHAEPIGLKGDYHPLAKLPLAKHPFGW